MKIRLFGPMQAEYQEEELLFRSDKIRGLFAYLIFHYQQPIRRDKIVDLLWGDLPEKQAKANLRSSLTRLRKSLAPAQDHLEKELLIADRQHVTLTLSPQDFWTDTQEYQTLLDTCRNYPQGEWWRRSLCIELLQKANELYKKPFLNDLTFTDAPSFNLWRGTLSERYRQQIITALEALSSHYLALDLHEEARRYAERLLIHESWNEEAHRLLIRSYILTGEKRSALQQYKICQECVKNELGAEPEQATHSLARQIQRMGKDHKPEEFEGSIPRDTTPFIGRKKELEELLPRLFDPAYPLLSILGPGGTGKSRLAREAARRLHHHFADGVWFIPITKIETFAKENSEDSDIHLEHLCSHIARVLGFRFFGSNALEEQLIAFLHEKEMLLILDNFDHLQERAEVLSIFVQRLPLLKIIATSRKRLYLQSESIFKLDGLHIPTSSVPSTFSSDLWLNYSGLQLFQERAKRLAPNFQIDENNFQALIDICTELGGNPLAIELASSWIHDYSLSQILENIRKNIDFLKTPLKDIDVRHQSIRVVLKESWESLSTEKQCILSKLSVFKGTFSEEIAEQVIQCSPAQLKELSDNYLLKENEQKSYQQHDLFQTFAFEQLQKQPELYQQTREQHSEYYLKQLEQWATQYESRSAELAFQESQREFNNILLAWRWLLESKSLSALIKSTWWMKGTFENAALYREGYHAFSAAMELLEEDPECELKQQALSILSSSSSYMLHYMGRYEKAFRFAQRAITFAQCSESKRLLLIAKMSHCFALADSGKLESSIEALEDALVFETEYPNPDLRLKILRLLGYSYLQKGPIEKGEKLLNEGLALAIKEQNLHLESQIRSRLAHCKVLQGSFQEAIKILQHAIQQAQELGNAYVLARFRYLLGTHLGTMGQYDESTSLFLKAQKHFTKHGNSNMQLSVVISLGCNYMYLGQWDEAERYCKDGIAHSQELNNPRMHAYSLSNLCSLYIQKGEAEKAGRYEPEAFRAVEHIDSTFLENALHSYSGKRLLMQGDIESAKHHFTLAKAGFDQAGMQNNSMENTAELARSCLQNNEPDEALQHVEKLLTYLDEHSLESSAEPLRAYLTCFQVLQHFNDPRANDMLQTAHKKLKDRSSKLRKKQDKESFLNIPLHKDIQKAWVQHKNPK